MAIWVQRFVYLLARIVILRLVAAICIVVGFYTVHCIFGSEILTRSMVCIKSQIWCHSVIFIK